ncbi:hypothetical protein A3K93_05395 [Acinetobacter sp. NCu2D-2]|nr:hypothetical protein A3K93_05395 [Acinetobacter sp. NCu2D-2]
MGFRLGLFIGGAWLKRVSSQQKSLKANFDQLLELEFTSLVAAHGSLCKDNAKSKLKDIVSKTFE